ncbi:hypothetical protein M4I17_09800 [Enterococcus thailandicus]|uniref:hypothetical protein n=2 Tax=Enterococcus thailandicus TaxID=417368 RepID=UPI00254290BF|nr:hypothetical protein [Enterococcus thailandicus]MDK4352691.1 hypothetical protein [Enterococcus thailandicus]
MNWSAFFSDLTDWMNQANQVLQRSPITSDEYWKWLVKTTGELGNKYNNHPLVVKFIATIIEYQDENYKKLTGRG